MPIEIAEMYTFHKRVPLMPSLMQTDYKWIENPEQPNWNIQDIDALINLIKNGNLHGGYGKDVSNEMKDIIEEHMIDNVSSVSKWSLFQKNGYKIGIVIVTLVWTFCQIISLYCKFLLLRPLKWGIVVAIKIILPKDIHENAGN